MDYVAFDLETTGIDPDFHRIIEIGAVRFKHFEPVAQYNQLVNPEMAIPPDAQQVHGISQEMVADKPVIKQVLGTFADFCDDSPLVAHNARFDFRFMLAAVKMHSSRAPSGRVIDTFSLAKRVLPGVHNYKLETLIRHYGIESGTFHRAAEDAEYCGRVFAELVKALQGGGHPCDLDSLIELTDKKEMVFPQYSGMEQLGLF